MHAAFPRFPPEIHQAMRLGHAHGVESGVLLKLEEMVVGSLVADAMATLLEFAFCLIVWGDKIEHGARARFFEENFVFCDQNAPGGIRYYQGKFLITTRNPDEDMNVLLEFCPNPAEFIDGETPKPSAIVRAKAISREQAEILKTTPFAFDLLIQFRDISAILGLIGTADLDMVELMLQNKVQMRGNTGHLFKLGAISESIEAAVGIKD